MTESNKLADIRRSNLRRWMQLKEITNTDLAGKLGVGRAYVSTLFNPERFFGEKAARSIEQKLYLPSMYLDVIGGNPDGHAIESWSEPDDLPEDVFALVPRISVELSAGPGTFANSESNLPPLAFRSDWLRKKLVSKRENLRICQVRGDSMTEYLQDGDSVLIDSGQIEITDGEIYAIRYGDELRVKRLSKKFNGGLIISSDNKRYSDEAINPGDLGVVQVLGRVLWRGG